MITYKKYLVLGGIFLLLILYATGVFNRILLSFSDCSDPVVKTVIENQNLSPIKSCYMESHIVDGEVFSFVDIFYGEGQDCPSGCIYKRWTGVTKGHGGNTIVSFNDRRSPLLDNSYLYSADLPRACWYSHSLEGDIRGGSSGIERNLIKNKKGELKWEYLFNQYLVKEILFTTEGWSCELGGRVTIDLDGSNPEIQFTSVKFPQVNTCEEYYTEPFLSTYHQHGDAIQLGCCTQYRQAKTYPGYEDLDSSVCVASDWDQCDTLAEEFDRDICKREVASSQEDDSMCGLISVQKYQKQCYDHFR